MESLPNEFLSHHLPLLFFAGASPPLAPTPASTSAPGHVQAPVSSDQFEALTASLRAALAPKPPVALIWDPHKNPQATPEFRVIMVDKGIRFPPRKTRPSSIQSTTNSVAHSPLSPLSKTSPLFPDGLMTPIWIRKHRDMIPCVFVLTLKLWEPASVAQNSRKIDSETEQYEHEQQKKFDHELIYEIIDRKKTTSERGIKLAVIILTSRYMLDNPDLDFRLSYIRKQSGLDSRASLFILSPVPQQDILNFANTLKTELYESAIDYYREHSRRVRRKRSRSSATASLHSTSYNQPGQPVVQPLGPQGWNVRSDYKLATFAEFRQEYDVAIKSYEDCWEGLIQMFSSTATLPPRTKRWAEAKVLIDCISVKISKLYMYSNEPSRSMHQFNKHVQRFRDLCNGWGIGDETYEFWAWLSKQYTVLADLIDIGCRNGMRLPNLLPIQAQPPDKSPRPNSPSATGVASTGRAAGGGALNVASVLVHPGFHYFHAAQCAVERRDKFRASEAAEEQMRLVAKSKDEGADFQGSLALAHERKINHTEMIIGLYTKAYEIFKSVGANRMTLFLALKIATVHLDQGDYATAFKFFERILTTYRKDKFGQIIETVLHLCYQSVKVIASQKAQVEIKDSVSTQELVQLLRLSFELIGCDVSSLSPEAQKDICSHMAELMQPLSQPAQPDSGVLSLEVPSSAFPVQCQIAFWESWIEVGDRVTFQVLVRVPQSFADCHLSLASVGLQLSSFPPITIGHQECAKIPSHRTIDLGILSDQEPAHTADLRIKERSILLITGTLKPPMIGTISLEKVVFRLDRALDGKIIEFITTPVSPEGGLGDGLQWVQELDPEQAQPVYICTEVLHSVCSVQPKNPRMTVSLIYERYGLIEEERVVGLEIRSEEESDHLTVKLDMKLIAPATDDTVVIENHGASASLQGIELGDVAPKTSVRKTLSLRPSSITGPRTLACTFHTQARSSSAEAADGTQLHDSVYPPAQMTKTAVLEVEEPFKVFFKVQHLHECPPNQAFHSLSFDKIDPWEISSKAVINAVIQSNIGTILALRNVELACETASCPVRICSSSLSSKDTSEYSIDLIAGAEFSASFLVEIACEPPQAQVLGVYFKTSWSCSGVGNESRWHVNQVPLSIEMPPQQPALVITNLPPHLSIYETTEISYAIKNTSGRHTLEVCVQVDPTDQWVFSGPRRIERMMILPRSQRTIALTAVPVAMGEIEGPKVQVFERIYRHHVVHANQPSVLVAEIEAAVDEENGEEETGEDRAGPEEHVQMRELEVVRDLSGYEVDPLTPNKESRAPPTPSPARVKKLKVLVLPV